MAQKNKNNLLEENMDTVVDSGIAEKVLKINQKLLEENPTKFSLYVRAPNWIKERNSATNKLLEIYPKITALRHPRQKSANYCFVDFANADDRDKSYEEMKNNPTITVKAVTKDNSQLLEGKKNKIVEKREAKVLARKMLVRHKTMETQEKEMTNQIIIAKIPNATTTSELKNHFPDAVDINMKFAMNQKKFKSAIVTFAAPIIAKIASQNKVTLHGEDLKVRLNIGGVYKKLEKSEKLYYKMIKKQNEQHNAAQENKKKVSTKTQVGMGTE